MKTSEFFQKKAVGSEHIIASSKHMAILILFNILLRAVVFTFRFLLVCWVGFRYPSSVNYGLVKQKSEVIRAEKKNRAIVPPNGNDQNFFLCSHKLSSWPTIKA